MMRFLLSTLFVILGAAWTLTPHPWNFAPVGAIALFAGATYERRSTALAVPVLTAVLADLLRGGFHEASIAVYASYALIALLGIALRARRTSPLAVGGGAIASATIFYLVTNGAMWPVSVVYPPTFAGLVACYIGGLPYYLNTLVSDLAFSAFFFGAYALAERRIPEPQA